MYNASILEDLGSALVDLIGFLNSPQRDQALLNEAGVELDRALFPLLVAIHRSGSASVADIADRVGRDHTTVSRQLSKLESRGFIIRREDEADRRANRAELTDSGLAIVRAIGGARKRLLAAAVADWNEDDLAKLAALNRRFADTLKAFGRSQV